MKKILALILIVASSALLFAGGTKEAQGDSSLSVVKEKGVFILGLDDSFPPMGFRDEKGEIVGFDIDLAREVCLRMGVELKLQPIDWDAKILDLNSRDIDAIWNGLTITDERKESITFSKPYIANRQIIIVKTGSGIDTIAALSGRKVGLQLGSSAENAVMSRAGAAESFGEMNKYQDNVQALMDLEVGRIDAVVVDEILGRYYISKKPGLFSVAAEAFAEEQYGIGFRLGDLALAGEVDRILDEMDGDGTAAEISAKWFGEDVLLPR